MKRSFDKDKFITMLKIVSKVVKMIMLGFYILFGLLLVGTVVVLFISKSNFDYDLANLEHVNVQIMNMNYDLGSLDLSGIVNVKSLLLTGGIVGMVYVVFAQFYMYMLNLILKDTKDKQPFSENNIKYMRYLGIGFIVSAFVLPAFGMLISSGIVHQLGLGDFTVDYMFDLKSLFMGLLILVLSGIFDYGAYLQEEYDMTV